MIALVAFGAYAADSAFVPDDAKVRPSFHAELGFLAPLAHHIQFDSAGTRLDYVKDGGQDNLFPFVRAQAELDVGRSRVRLLFQPLVLNTRVALPDALTVDDTTFAAGTPLDLLYGFTFWRAGWMYDVAKGTQLEAAFGMSMQIRNADIEFTSADGTQRVAERNIGPVPLLAARLGQDFPRWWWQWEADGAYAPVSYLNGDNNEVVGSLLDTSVRFGLNEEHGIRPFANLRYLGGGAKGYDTNHSGPGDGYADNFLNFLTVSIGAQLR